MTSSVSETFEPHLRSALTIEDPATRAETLRIMVEMLLFILDDRERAVQMLRDDQQSTHRLLTQAIVRR